MINVNEALKEIREKGIVVLDEGLPAEVLDKMQQTFNRQLAQPQFNTWSGYQQNEKWRLLIENLLTHSSAFLYPALQPQLMEICRQYIGEGFQMTEARGWKTIKTNRNFHGWHIDGWYDINKCKEIPPQIKIATYLTDVDSGEFCYLEGSHRNNLNHDNYHWSQKQVDEMDGKVRHVKAKAGSIFMFDTSGIHRQNSPVLDERCAVLYNFHDPSVPIQAEDVAYNRYSPLLLNAAFLKDLTKEQERILGFGDDRYFQEEFVPTQRYPLLHNLTKVGLNTRLLAQDCGQFMQRVKRVVTR
jgi:hypothetical protein